MEAASEAGPCAEVNLGDDPLPCPSCGYDLRAATSNRCSECGKEFDPADLRQSQIPWARRREIGRVWAYIKTVWMVTIDSRKLRYEAFRPQDAGDARAFRRVTSGVLALVLVGVFAWAAIAEHRRGVEPNDLRQRAIEALMPAGTNWSMPGQRESNFLRDFAATMLGGVFYWFAIPLYLVVLAWYWAGLPRAVFRVSGMPAAAAEQARAVANYTSAPLVWLVPALLVSAAFVWLDPDKHQETPNTFVAVLCVGFLSLLLVLFTLLLAFARPAQWMVRTRHLGAGSGLLAVAELLLLSILGAIVMLAVVPCCVGFLWVVISSLS